MAVRGRGWLDCVKIPSLDHFFYCRKSSEAHCFFFCFAVFGGFMA
jgi:hypothetical protein